MKYNNDMSLQHNLLILLTSGFILGAVIWIATSPKNTNRKILFFKKIFIFRFIGTVLAIILSCLSSLYFPVPSTVITFPIVILGIVLYLTGLLLAIWAKISMGNFWNLPSGNDSMRQTKLLTSGPFSLTRNPIYAGRILMFFGYSLAIRSVFVFLSIIDYMTLMKFIYEEEKLLADKFGSEYVKYMAKVPRLFPFT